MSQTTITTLHICYIHGWQGDHTSFQSFPTDLHDYLVPRLPSNITLNTHIYPTYKAARPIFEAVAKLLKWLHTIPEGFVILAGHSLGGFLTADAAIEGTRMRALRQRIVGMIAFDVPFLGIHPHVIVSGIASILPHDGPKESEVNDQTKVNFVSPNESTATLASTNSPPPSPSSPSPPKRSFHHRYRSFLDKASTFVQKYQDVDPVTATFNSITEFFEFGSAVVDKNGMAARYNALEQWGAGYASAVTSDVKSENVTTVGGDWIHFYTVTVPNLTEEDRLRMKVAASAAANDLPDGNLLVKGGWSSPYMQDLKQHRHHADSSSETSSIAPGTVGGIAVEVDPDIPTSRNIEVGSSSNAAGTQMALDFEKLKEKAREEKAQLEQKRAAGTSPKPSSPTTSFLGIPASPTRAGSGSSIRSISSGDFKHEVDSVSLRSPSPPSHTSTITPNSSATPPKKKHHSPHHFILLPHHPSSKWQSVPIAVDSEVDAHTGIFFKDKNLEYDILVARVGAFVTDILGKHSLIS